MSCKNERNVIVRSTSECRTVYNKGAKASLLMHVPPTMSDPFAHSSGQDVDENVMAEDVPAGTITKLLSFRLGNEKHAISPIFRDARKGLCWYTLQSSDEYTVTRWHYDAVNYLTRDAYFDHFDAKGIPRPVLAHLQIFGESVELKQDGPPMIVRSWDGKKYYCDDTKTYGVTDLIEETLRQGIPLWTWYVKTGDSVKKRGRKERKSARQGCRQSFDKFGIHIPESLYTSRLTRMELAEADDSQEDDDEVSQETGKDPTAEQDHDDEISSALSRVTLS